jgi:hypothetical protein
MIYQQTLREFAYLEKRYPQFWPPPTHPPHSYPVQVRVVATTAFGERRLATRTYLIVHDVSWIEKHPAEAWLSLILNIG